MQKLGHYVILYTTSEKYRVMTNNPYAKYTSTSITTGHEAQQLIVVYDEILKLLYQAKKCLENGDIEGKFKNLDKVLSIFLALQSGISSLDHEIVRSLDRFYGATIIQVNKLNMSTSATEEMDKFIAQIRKVRDATVAAAQNEGLI